MPSGLVSGESSLLAYRRLPSHCASQGFSSVLEGEGDRERERERKGYLVSLPLTIKPQ